MSPVQRIPGAHACHMGAVALGIHAGTVRQGLRLVAAGETFRRLSALRGTVKFSVDLRRLREDRS